MFEEYNIESLFKAPAPQIALGALNNPDIALVVDSGYSFTHVIPFKLGQPLNAGIKRINVGGKVLTNFLKETISFRHYNMMEETYLMNEIKETCCYVSLNFSKDKQEARNLGKLQKYVLPDFSTNRSGYVLKVKF